METITIEEKKRLIEWMGWEVKYDYEPSRGKIYVDGKRRCRLFEFTPENGGQDLTEVLGKLSNLQKISVHSYTHKCDNLSLLETIFDIEYGIWFQAPDNAPTIIKAVLEAIG